MGKRPCGRSNWRHNHYPISHCFCQQLFGICPLITFKINVYFRQMRFRMEKYLIYGEEGLIVHICFENCPILYSVVALENPSQALSKSFLRLEVELPEIPNGIRADDWANRLQGFDILEKFEKSAY